MNIRLITLSAIAVALVATCTTAQASTFTFNTDPFAGTNVLNTPGRQIVGGEDFISFSPATDVFALDSTVFGVQGPVRFENTVAGRLPDNGLNVVVLEST